MTTRKDLLSEALDFLDPGAFELYPDYHGRFHVRAAGVTTDTNGVRLGVAIALAYLCQPDREEDVQLTPDRAEDVLRDLEERDLIPERSDNMGRGTIFY